MASGGCSTMLYQMGVGSEITRGEHNKFSKKF
jgi:hypothetical protein